MPIETLWLEYEKYFKQAWNEVTNNKNFWAPRIDLLFELYNTKQVYVWFIYEDNTFLGYIVAEPQVNIFDKLDWYLHISSLYILPEHRGFKVLKPVLNEIKSISKLMALEKIQIDLPVALYPKRFKKLFGDLVDCRYMWSI